MTRRARHPTLIAPGENIVSLRGAASQTSAVGLALGADRDRLAPSELPFYTTASGTSFSAPQVASAVALMLEANRNLTTGQIKDILQRTATPKYFRHEAGAGMLNTYAAVIEAAFPERRMGLFRSILDRGAISFTTSESQNFENTVMPNASVVQNFNLTTDVIQAGVHIAWNLGTNDLALRVFDINGNLKGESNYLNAPGLTGRREKVIMDYPDEQNYQAVIQNTGNLGTTPQKFTGIIEITRPNYQPEMDFQSMSPPNQSIVKESLRSFLMFPFGAKFQSAQNSSPISASRAPSWLPASCMRDACRSTWRKLRCSPTSAI